MEYSFNLPIKAFSVNAYYYKNRAIKTKEARAWEAVVLWHLREHPSLLEMADKWRISCGIFHIRICNNYPRHMYYNKHGQVSAKTFDITNCEKPLVDLIMNNFMNVNDRYLTVCVSSKGPVMDRQSIDITIKLLSEEESK